MYTLQKLSWGYNIGFAGTITHENMTNWLEESKASLKTLFRKDFGVIVNMANMKVMTPECKKILEEGQKEYLKAGMKRSAVIVESAIVAMQLKGIAKLSGIDKWERYIDGSNVNWPKLASDWVEKGIEPTV